MKETTDHMTTRRWKHAPDAAVGAGLACQMPDLKARADTAKHIPINEGLVEDGFTLWRGACFADGNAGIGHFARMENSGGII